MSAMMERLAAEAVAEQVGLKGKQREVWLWRVTTEMNHSQVAAIVGVTPLAASQAYSRASNAVYKWREANASDENEDQS